jgi:hypothetical protein
MKRLVAIMIVTAIGAVAFAAPGGRRPHPASLDEAFLRAEMDQALAGERDTALGTLTVGQLQELLGRLSVAQQKAAFIARSRAMSMMMPGVGQFVNKDALSGALFLTADLALIAGTLVGAYFLLPADLRFDRLDYFNASYADISRRWESHSFVDVLPTLAVLAGGGLLKAVLGGVSAHHAEKLARRNIEEGKITFEPRLVLLPHGPMGMGWGMDFRY